MPIRQPYDISVAGLCHFERPNGSDPMDNLNASARRSESFAGVSRKKPVGFIPPTAYQFFHRTVDYANGISNTIWLLAPNGAVGSKYSGNVGGGTGCAFSSEEHFQACCDEGHLDEISLRNRALIKARNALKDSDVNLGVAFAERSATARLVGDTASNLAKTYRFLRRGQIRRAMDSLGISSARREPRGSNAPQKWLELQYGWKPLLSDIYGTCNALSKRGKSDWRVTAKGTASASQTVEKQFSTVGAGSCAAHRESRSFVRIDALPDNDALISLASLGITNPLLIGWELVPFSFVVDWFLPVGGYLESLDALLGYTTMGYSSTVTTRTSWDGFGRTEVVGSFRYENSFKESKRIVRLNREVSTSVPFPHFPRFKDPRSLDHMANGLSLLASAFGRH